MTLTKSLNRASLFESRRARLHDDLENHTDQPVGKHVQTRFDVHIVLMNSSQ